MAMTTTAAAPPAAGRDARIAWFERVVTCYQRRAFIAALGFLGNPEDAREASQEAFARAFRALDSYDPDRPFYPWFHRILRNLCLNRIERRRRAPVASDELERVGTSPTTLLGRSPETAAIDDESQLRVQRAIENLSVQHREIITMRHYQDLSYEEMAEALGVPVGTVMSRLYRARAALRTTLSERE